MESAAAPQLRTDWLTGRTVIFAEHRADRPNEFAADAGAAGSPGQSTDCPFCPSHESQTPPAVYSREDEAGHWQIRVVPNMFPVVSLPNANGVGAAIAAAGTIPAEGAHEVIIESARHVDRSSALSVAEFGEVLAAYSARLAHWHDDGRFQYGLVFKNVGTRAGASLSHIHSQLLALPQLPPTAAAEFGRAEQHFGKHQRCVYCDLLDSERAAGERIVLDYDGLIAFCPYVSLQPCEVWLMPTDHEPWFERRPLVDVAGRLAEVLHRIVARIEAIVPHSAYNLLVRTAPWLPSAAAWGHWRIEVLPRVNSLAGIELATGIHINPISPPRAAKELRVS
jgi:UDPglucose--hexose-1-phosphate uridylyltransferase